MSKLEHDKKTLNKMFDIYYKHHRIEEESNPTYAGLRTYAEQRLERCPFAEQKPNCDKCAVHCYRPEERALIQKIMRYSGPRMMLYHPYYALRHLYYKWF